MLYCFAIAHAVRLATWRYGELKSWPSLLLQGAVAGGAAEPVAVLHHPRRPAAPGGAPPGCRRRRLPCLLPMGPPLLASTLGHNLDGHWVPRQTSELASMLS